MRQSIYSSTNFKMPKRNNPFGDHSSLQLKTHVGEKEVDKGVCQQTRMQTVYERTQALLFKGMKERQHQEADMVVDVNENLMSDANAWEGNQANTDGPSSMRQLHLNRNCELVCTGTPQCEDMMESDSMSEVGLDSRTKDNPSMPSSFLFGNVTVASDYCTQPVLPTSFGFSFGRQTGALSPSCPPSSTRLGGLNTSPFKESCGSGSNAFSLLMKSQAKSDSLGGKSLCRACHNCRRPVRSLDVIKCQFCEQYVCSGCVRQCQNCFLHYCQLCSFVNYDQSSERAFCLTCSGR